MSHKLVDTSATPASDAGALPPVERLSLAEDKPAPWYRLPVELKRKIIDDVLATYDEVCLPARDESEVALMVGCYARKLPLKVKSLSAYEAKRKALQELQRVNAELRSICIPLLWKCVYLQASSYGQLERLLAILPKHAAHVRYFHIGRRFRNQEMDKLASRALWLCNEAEEVTIGTWYEAADAFKPTGLTTVTVLSAMPSTFEVDFLRQQSNLTSLALTGESRQDWQPVRELGWVGDILRHLPHLQHLRLQGSILLDDPVVASATRACVAAKPPLTSLELVDRCTTVSLRALVTFILTFSRTLTSLRIEIWSEKQRKWHNLNTRDLLLPRLSFLFLRGNWAAPFFHHLSLPAVPIALVNLDDIPNAAIHTPSLLIFLHEHAQTLARVHLGRAALSSSGSDVGELSREAVEEYCAALGIELTIQREASAAATSSSDSGDAESRSDGEEEESEDDGIRRYWVHGWGWYEESDSEYVESDSEYGEEDEDGSDEEEDEGDEHDDDADSDRDSDSHGDTDRDDGAGHE
ncbi:hypothetical protein JCM3770_003574 [Rhodotorula araucariae]